MAASGEFVEHTTAMAVEEKAKLQKHFSRFDMLFFLICTLVGVDTLGQVSSYGAQGFTWLIFLGIFFFIPYALLTAEIGSAFTEEGGPYVWTKLAWGRFLACLNGVLYWISNPIWMGGLLTITAIETFSVFFTSLDNRVLFYGFGALFIWFGTVAAILSFGIGKWIPTIGAWSRMIMLGFFTLTTIIYAAKEGVHAPSFGDFKPTYALFIGLVPVLFFNYVGFELPSTAGDEMENPQRDVPFTVLRSAIASILLYGVPILAIIFVLPAAALSGLGGFIDAMKTVFTVYGGNVTTASDGTLSVTLSGAGTVLGDLMALMFIWALLSSGTTWIMGADRALAVASFDGCGPRFLGTFSARFGTPVNVNLMSGIMSTAVMVLAHELSSGSSAKYFGAVLGVALLTTTMSYLLIYPALIKLRYSHPHVHRPYTVPFGMAGVWIIGCLTTLWAALATVAGVWPGFLTDSPSQGLMDAYSFSSRTQFEAIAFGSIAVILAIGVLFYILGTPTRRQLVDVPIQHDVDPGTAEAPATA